MDDAAFEAELFALTVEGQGSETQIMPSYRRARSSDRPKRYR
jgi:hypothetical protein